MLGCSFSWEGELEKAGCIPRHVELDSNVPMFRTDVDNAPSGTHIHTHTHTHTHKHTHMYTHTHTHTQFIGVFKGKLVVSMRPYRRDQVCPPMKIGLFWLCVRSLLTLYADLSCVNAALSTRPGSADFIVGLFWFGPSSGLASSSYDTYLYPPPHMTCIYSWRLCAASPPAIRCRMEGPCMRVTPRCWV